MRQKWISGRTISRYGFSSRGDISSQLSEEVAKTGLVDGFSVRPGTINVELDDDLEFDHWDVDVDDVLWEASGIRAGCKLKQCWIATKTGDKWVKTRAYLYDPCNPDDPYLSSLRKWEIFASEEIEGIRARSGEVEIRIALVSVEESE